jgi:hypothetical protein
MNRRRQHRERGGVTLILVMVLLMVAILVGALAVRGATTDLRSAGAERVARTGFYCAEAGLNAARPFFAANYGQWNAYFADQSKVVTGDLDGDGQNDYSVTLQDNYDELPPLANAPTVDNDLTAIMTSTCISPSMTNGPRVLKQIVTLTGNLGTDYRYQAGHSSTHSGNEN